jgi:hypothetical protein
MALDLSSSLNGALDDGFSAAIKAPKPKEEPAEAPVQLAGPPPTGEPPVAPEDKSGIRAAGEKQIAAEAQERRVQELKSAQAKGETAAKQAREAAVYAEYKPRLTAPYETFKPTGDTASSLASLGLMIGMLGAMGGKKGLTSATGAMNAIAGMMTGYQQGSKEKYDKERQIFEENLKIAQQNHALVEKEFERAVKYAKYDLTGATNSLIKSRLAAGDPTGAKVLQDNGLVAYGSQLIQAGGKINGEIKKETDRMIALQEDAKRAKIEVEARKAETKSEPLVPVQTAEGVVYMTRSQAEGQKVGARPSARAGVPLTDEQQEKLAHGVANYAINPKDLPSNLRAAVLERAMALNENYDARDYGNQGLAARNWSQPNGAGAKQIAAFATVAQHLDVLQELADAQNKFDTPKINKMVNYFKTELGYPEVTDFNTAKQAVASEVVKATTGTAGALADRQEAERALSAAASPEQTKGAINTIKKLIAGRIETSRAMYVGGTGKTPESFNKLLPENIRDAFGEYVPSLRGDRSTTAPAPTGVGGQSNPHKPTSTDEFNKIKKGEYFIDPDDGNLYRK